ncbi:MAG: hypothetical protein Q9214_005574, partial [Letrouitia sp. 1 TL-2023]
GSTIAVEAAKGFANAASYDTYRPSYPAEAVEDLLEKLQVAGVAKAKIVEVGAGTGKFTEALAARNEGFEIVAVEPHEEMQKLLKSKQLKGVKVVGGDAMNLPIDSQSTDAVIAAQVDPYSFSSRTPWESTLKDILWSVNDDHPRFRDETWRQVFEKQLSSTPITIQGADPLFTLPLGENSVNFTDWSSSEATWERFRSLSQITVLKGDQLENGSLSMGTLYTLGLPQFRDEA